MIHNYSAIARDQNYYLCVALPNSRYATYHYNCMKHSRDICLLNFHYCVYVPLVAVKEAMVSQIKGLIV